MRLIELRLRQFRKFDEAVFGFDPGLNIVVGPNEAGKSTLRHALLTAFFVNPATAAKRREEWRPWGSETLGWLSLEFEYKDRRFELRKDFERRKMVLRELLTGREWEGSNVQERLQGALGLSTEGLFRSTAMIEQTEIASLRVGSGDIGQRLSRIVQAGPGDAEAGVVLKKLERELAELEKGMDRPVKTPGSIRRLQQEVADLDRRHTEAQGHAARVEAMRAELRGIVADHDAAAENLATRQALLRANQEFLALEEELKRLRQQETGLAERVLAIEEGLAGLATTARDLEALQAAGVPDDNAIATLQGAAGRADRQRETVSAARHAVARRETEVIRLEVSPEVAETPRAIRGRPRAVAAGLLVLTTVLVLLGVWLPDPRLFAVAAAAGGAGGVALWISWQQRRAAEIRRARWQSAADALDDARAALATGEETLAQEERALEVAVAATGSGSRDEAHRRHQEFRRLREERNRLHTRVETLLGGRTLDDLRTERDRVRADQVKREIYLSHPENQVRRLTVLEVGTLDREVSGLTERVHHLAARRDLLERSTGEGTVDFEALATLAEELAERREALEATRRRARVVREILDVLREARQQTLIPARRQVEERAGEYLRLLTGDPEAAVHLEEPPLRVTVWVARADRWLEPAEPQLSRGTVDQVYLAVRLALVEVLSENQHPPLLLDDPFGTFDPGRLQAAMALLRRISERHQVLLFTCRPEYEPFGDRIIPIAATGVVMPVETPGPLWQIPPPTTH